MGDLKIRLSTGEATVPEVLRGIVDHEDFQRLRSVKQLALVDWVYPGAVHHRLEHSLSVLQAALRFLDSVRKEAPLARGDDLFGEEARLHLAAAALLHDIGHFPFSHLLEESGFIRHETLGRDLVSGEFGPVLSKAGLDPARVASVAFGPNGRTERRWVSILHSIMDSDLDADKWAYTEADGRHCGLPYGLYTDRERILSNLTLNGQRNHIAILPYARTAAEFFVLSRYALFRELFWHRRVRGMTVMVKRALEIALEADPSLLGRLRVLSDREVLQTLAHEGDILASGLARSLLERRIYRRIATVPTASPLHRAVVSNVLHFEAALNGAFRANPTEILIDFPPPEKDALKGFPVTQWENGVVVHESRLEDTGVLTALKGYDFAEQAKPVRVFCEPGKAAEIESRTDENGILSLLEEAAP